MRGLTCLGAEEVVSAVYQQLTALEPGDWSGREWQKVDRKKVDTTVVNAIDDLLVETWQALPKEQKTLWHLNCLFYAGKLEVVYTPHLNHIPIGAKAVRVCAVQGQQPTGTMERDTDSENEEETELMEHTSLQTQSHLTGARQSKEVQAIQTSIVKLDSRVKCLRQTVSWLKIEREQIGHKLNHSKTSLRRRYVRRKMLLKGLKFEKHSVNLCLEKYRSLLRVKEGQRATKRQFLKRQQQHSMLQDRGPRALVNEMSATAASGRTSFKQAEVEDLGGVYGR